MAGESSVTLLFTAPPACSRHPRFQEGQPWRTQQAIRLAMHLSSLAHALDAAARMSQWHQPRGRLPQQAGCWLAGPRVGLQEGPRVGLQDRGPSPAEGCLSPVCFWWAVHHVSRFPLQIPTWTRDMGRWGPRQSSHGAGEGKGTWFALASGKWTLLG